MGGSRLIQEPVEGCAGDAGREGGHANSVPESVRIVKAYFCPSRPG